MYVRRYIATALDIANLLREILEAFSLQSLSLSYECVTRTIMEKLSR